MNKELSPQLQALKAFAESKYLPEIPTSPEEGAYYRITPAGAVCANGAPYHGVFKKGRSDGLIVYFSGGGASWNEHMARHPINLYTQGVGGYYFDDVNPLSDLLSGIGIMSSGGENPFRDDSIVNICYASGDWHVGDTDFDYTDLEGNAAILHHHGYRNFMAVMQRALPHLSSVQRLLVCGSSAGAFGATALCDDVAALFPDCKNVTCCADGGLLRGTDWGNIFRFWNAPQCLCNRIGGDNLIVDLFAAHAGKYRMLFLSSLRDAELSRYQNYLDGGEEGYTREGGERFFKALRDTVVRLRAQDGNVHFYLFDTPADNAPPETRLTLHTLLGSNAVFEQKCGMSAADWLWRAVNGQPTDVGMKLL